MLLYELLSKYDAFEVHPVVALDADGDLIKQKDFTRIAAFELEQCDEIDPNIYCWSIYGHLPNGGVECLVDCPTKELAEAITKRIVSGS